MVLFVNIIRNFKIFNSFVHGLKSPCWYCYRYRYQPMVFCINIVNVGHKYRSYR